MDGEDKIIQYVGDGARGIAQSLSKFLQVLSREIQNNGGEVKYSKLAKTGQKISPAVIDSDDLREFNRLAHKYHLKYSLEYDKSSGKYTISFYQKDIMTLNQIVKEMKEPPNKLRERIRKGEQRVNDMKTKTKEKVKEKVQSSMEKER